MSRILIVEDEVLIGMMLEDMLALMAHEVVGNAATLAEARTLAAATPFDLAILDVHVAGEPVFGFAEHVIAMGVRIVFATGSSGGAVPTALRAHPMLSKPYDYAAVAAVIDAVKANAPP